MATRPSQKIIYAISTEDTGEATKLSSKVNQELAQTEQLNNFYQIDAVSMQIIDGALVCQITRRQLDKVLRQRNEKIVITN